MEARRNTQPFELKLKLELRWKEKVKEEKKFLPLN